MEDVRFERQYRTTSSEVYLLYNGEDRIGRLDLHYTPTIVCATLLIERELPEDDVLDLVEHVDDELVMSASVPREDFVVSVYQGREIGTYSDEFFGEDEESGESP